MGSLFGRPALLGFLPWLPPGPGRFEIEDRRVVEGVDLVDGDDAAFDRKNLARGDGDEVGPDGRVRGKNPGQRIVLVAARVDMKDAPFLGRIVLVKPPEDDYVGTVLQAVESGSVLVEDLQLHGLALLVVIY